MAPSLNIFGLVIPTYALILSLIFSIGPFWVVHRARLAGLSDKIAIDLCMIAFLFGMIGARLLHVLYEEPKYYLEDPTRTFYFWEGGFVFYGGLIFAFLASTIFLRIKKESFYDWSDLMAPVLALTYAIGRFGCFLNGCCYGLETQVSWSLMGRHPTQLYAMSWELGVFFLLLFLEKRPCPKGMLFFLWLSLHGLGRIIMEAYRDDSRGPLIGGLSISVWISVLLIFAGIFWLRRVYDVSRSV